MKTIITILLSVLFISNISAQSVDSLRITETERIIDKYSGKIADTFEKGLEKITPIAEDGFKIMVKVQIVKGITGLIPLLCTIILTIIFFVYANKSEFGRDPIFADVMTIIFGFLVILSFVPTVIDTSNAVQHLMVPEYYAIQDIINMFK